jgi:hypothetical protein
MTFVDFLESDIAKAILAGVFLVLVYVIIRWLMRLSDKPPHPRKE